MITLPTSNPVSSPVSNPTRLAGDVPGLLKWHDSSVVSSVQESAGDVTQWDDLSGNGYHDTPLGNAPAYPVPGGPIVFDVGNTEALRALGFDLNAQIGSKEFVVVAVHDGVVDMGSPQIAPRLYLGETMVSYANQINFLLYGGFTGKTVTTWSHDGTDMFVRGNGIELDRDASTLVAMTSSPWQTRALIDGDLYRYAVYDASEWGASFTANLEAVEAAFSD